ncbi:MAG TPA: hypothetical protein VNO30_25535 [Kofleriaceae bacterium]|nr:hypothetical protein [Kofleriaceae bacterium]
MRRTIDPSPSQVLARELPRLFEARLDEDRREAAPYRTLAAELDAVRARKKAIAMFPLARPGDVPADDAFLRGLVRAAAARGLGVLVDPGEHARLPREARGVTAYALPIDQLWRVPAIAALWTAALEDGRWSDAAERQLGALLGYSARERRIWIAQLRHRIAAWGARTVYALLDRQRRALVEALGRRCLGPAPALEGLPLFVHARGHALRRDAARLAPRGLAIARVALDEPAYARLFGGRRAARGVIAATAGARTAAAIAAGLRSNVELLTAAGWR